MKRACCILGLLLMTVLIGSNICIAASAEIAAPLSANGVPIVLNSLIPYQDNLLVYHSAGKTIYLSDSEDNWQAYPIFWENTEARDVAVEARISAMEDLEMDTLLTSNDFYTFAAFGDELLAVGTYTGALYQVTFEESNAVMTYLAMLDVLPEKAIQGDLRITSVCADAESLYVLAAVNDDGQISADVLYAFDRTNWSGKSIPVNIPASCYLSSVHPWQDGMLLISAAIRSSHEDAGTYVFDPANSKLEMLQDYFGVFSLPGGYVYACDAEQGIVIFRKLTDDLLHSVSLEKGVIAFTRRKDISEQIVFHPDGRVLRFSRTAVEVVSPLQEMPITKLNVLSGGSGAPSIAMNSNIPDIQLISEERFGTEETVMDVFANAMTTQSSQYDIFILPIMQAESIIRKGYCVPMTSEPAEAFVADLYPHMAQ